jgi:hypothetical protein
MQRDDVELQRIRRELCQRIGYSEREAPFAETANDDRDMVSAHEISLSGCWKIARQASQIQKGCKCMNDEIAGFARKRDSSLAPTETGRQSGGLPFR